MNFKKSTICFSHGMNAEFVAAISAASGISIADDSGTYMVYGYVHQAYDKTKPMPRLLVGRVDICPLQAG